MINFMDHHSHKTKNNLEILTTEELRKMADAIGIDMPPDLERIFIIQELLEAGAETDLDEIHADSEELVDPNHILEPVLLPKQYNVNYLEVLFRDPLWAFVYWEINSLDRKTYESSPEFKGYFLHLIPLPLQKGDAVTDSFTISIGGLDNSWRIYLPPEINLFQINLCVNRKGRNEVIIASRQFRVPHVLDPADETVRNSPHYPMLRLSGIEEFEILRNVDKVSRIHRFSGD
jgi:hypothetical protein